MCRVSLVPQFSYLGSHLGNISICFSFLYLTVSCDVPCAWVEQVRPGEKQEFILEQSLGRNAVMLSPKRTKPSVNVDEWSVQQAWMYSRSRHYEDSDLTADPVRNTVQVYSYERYTQKRRATGSGDGEVFR